MNARSGTDKATTNVEAVLPVTALQEAMVVASLAEDASGVYVSQVVMELSRVPEPDCWWQAWRQVCARHEALRTVFLVKDRTEPVSVVLREVELNHSATQAIDDLDGWLLEDRKSGFDIESPPLHRHSLLTGVDQGQFRCAHVWTFHHAVCDGWSTQIVIDEVFEIYAALIEKRAVRLAAPVSLKSWFRANHQRTAPEAALSVMRQEQVGMIQPTPVPGSRAQASSLESAPLRFCVDALSAADWQALKATAARQQVTPASVVTAAWAMLLAALERQREVCFGVTFSARDETATGSLVGMIMHTLPVGFSVDQQASVSGWLAQVNRRIHRLAQAGPLDWPQLRELRREVSGGAEDVAPFFSLISFENVYESAVADDQPVTMLATRYIDQSNLPFSLVVVPGNQLEIRAYYHESVVSDALARRLLAFLLQALRNINSIDHDLVRDWHFVEEQERQQLVFDFSNGGHLGTTPSVVSRLEQCAQRYPDRLAIRQGTQKIDYASLWQQAGVVRDALLHIETDYVALVGPTSVALLSAMIGVLRSGRAYVPLDAAWPAERKQRVLRRLMRNGGVTVIADQSEFVDMQKTMPEHVQLLSLESCTSGEAAIDETTGTTTEAHSINDDATAYVMLTSGSSGEAKAVRVSHAALAASTAARDVVYAMPPARFLLLSSLAFDSSVAGIYWTLCNGGELVLTTAPLAQALTEVDQLVCHHRITHTLCLPSVHDYLLSSLSARGDHELACVIVAGEACPLSLLERHGRVLPETLLWNEYGPTESTVWSTAVRLFAPEDEHPPERITIGKPLPGVIVRVLDYHDRPVAGGFYGELLIGGRLLADGYIDDTDANAAKFVDDPLGIAGRMYRSGDLVRWDDNGELEFGGRLDGQIKVRGVRLEPGEIETAIGGLSMVRDVCVLQVHEADGTGPERLVAAVVKRQSGPYDAEQLSAQLAQILPAAMRPHHIVAIDALPRLPNGKLDRQQLEQQILQSLRDTRDSLAQQRPVDDSERRIAQHVEHILATAAPGAHQSLFSVGLDSLRAVGLLLAINQDIGCQLGIADLYAEPTIAGLAALARENTTQIWLRTVPMSPHNVPTAAAPLFFAYGNGNRIAEWAGADVSVHWMIHGKAETVMPIADFEELARQHIAQVKRVQAHGPYRLAGFSLGALLVMEISRQLIEAGNEVAWLGLIDPTSPKYFVKRGRHLRLQAALKSDMSVISKCRYLWQFVVRLPEFLHQRQNRATESGSDLIVDAVFGDATQTAGDDVADIDGSQSTTAVGQNAVPAGPSREEIVASVDDAISRFSPPRLACPVSLFRVGRGEQSSLEWHDDRNIWQEFFEQRIEYQQITSDSAHRDFFRDEKIAMAVSSWLKRQPVS